MSINDLFATVVRVGLHDLPPQGAVCVFMLPYHQKGQIGNSGQIIKGKCARVLTANYQGPHYIHHACFVESDDGSHAASQRWSMVRPAVLRWRTAMVGIEPTIAVRQIQTTFCFLSLSVSRGLSRRGPCKSCDSEFRMLADKPFAHQD